MRVLLTGASGFVGRAVQARLLADPETVMALAQHPALYRLWRLAEGSDES